MTTAADIMQPSIMEIIDSHEEDNDTPYTNKWLYNKAKQCVATLNKMSGKKIFLCDNGKLAYEDEDDVYLGFSFYQPENEEEIVLAAYLLDLQHIIESM